MINIIFEGDKYVEKLQKCKYCHSKWTMNLLDISLDTIVGLSGKRVMSCPVCSLTHEVDFSNDYYGGDTDVD